MTTASASSFSSSPCPYSSPWVRAWAANDLPLSAPGPPFGLANPRPSIRSNVSLRGSCTRRLVTSHRRSFASTPAMPRLSGSSETRGASGTGLGRDARAGSARNLPSLGPGASPPPFHPGRTLEGPNPDGPSGASPHSLSHSDDSSSGCRTLSCATPSSATLDTRSRCATGAPDLFVTRTAAVTGASASPALLVNVLSVCRFRDGASGSSRDAAPGPAAGALAGRDRRSRRYASAASVRLGAANMTPDVRGRALLGCDRANSLGTHEESGRSDVNGKIGQEGASDREAPRERWAIPSLSTRTRSTATW